MIKLKRNFGLYLLGIIPCVLLAFSLLLNVAAAETTVSVRISDGAHHVSIYADDGTEVSIDAVTKTISVEPGTYKYIAANGAGGIFEVTSETSELALSSVNFQQVSPSRFNSAIRQTQYLAELGELQVFDQTGNVEYWHATEDVNENGEFCEKEYMFLLPTLKGDGYFNFTFKPYDEEYLQIDGHFYVYKGEDFHALNLSDSGKIPYIKNEPVQIIAPKDMTVQTVWQLKFYTARNFKTYEPDKVDGDYAYYTISKNLTFRLSQEGKVTRYGTGTQIGEWNQDNTILTLRELQDDPTQIERNVGSYYASMLTNLPLNSVINLEVGEYFDLVPLRGWQAISDGASNEHQDPDWHYVVLGNGTSVASVEVTEDDVTGQFGRIHAGSEGTALVVFYYDAMESPNQLPSDNDEYGQYIWSALWPELTGIAVINVGGGESETTIDTNIELTEGKAIYYIRSQTDAQGLYSEMDDHAEYTFWPTAETDGEETAITSVRVLEPIMVTGGTLNRNPADWLKDSTWKSCPANGNGSYTLELTEGRNIVEIKAGDATAYHVILARGIDVTIENQYSPGRTLAVGDTAKITYEGILPPLFKLGAIYNPSGTYYHFDGNGVEMTASWGQYLPSASFSIDLTDEDVGTYEISDGYLSSPAWGELADTHRQLTRNSMGSSWAGGDSEEHTNDKVAIVPDIAFEVVSNDDLEEVSARNAGLLQGLRVYPTASNDAGTLGADVYKTGALVPQNASTQVTTILQRAPIKVGAVLADASNTKLLVRYWTGADSSTAVVEEISPVEIEYSQSSYGGSVAGIPVIDLEQNLLVSAQTREASVEVIVIPEDGYPMTYARHFYFATTVNQNTAHWPLSDLTISAASGQGTLGRFNGVLEAEDIAYVSTDGSTVTQDLGYGFIGTETSYLTSVPYEVGKIVLNATGSTAYGDTIEITVNSEETVYAGGEVIPLQEGENILSVTYKPLKGTKALNGMTYTIKVTRAAAPGHVTFDVPAGATVTVKSSGKTQEPLATNPTTGVYIYNLTGGTYDYCVELDGYYSKTGTFTAPDDTTIKVDQNELEPLPVQSGSFRVSIHGQQTEVCALTTMKIPEEIADLAAKKYVTFNYGGYTVLHALLNACDAAKKDYTCRSGVLTPSAAIDTSLISNGAGWVCEVNGEVVDPYSTLVKPGDVICYYYNNNSSGMVHAWFDSDNGGALTASRGESVTVTLLGAEVNGRARAASTGEPVEGADILVDGKKVAVTGEDGAATLETDELLLGTHRITAVKEENGVNILTYTLATLTLEKSVDPNADPDTTVVTFRLIGDMAHNSGDETATHAYTTWIATTEYTFAAESVTVGDVFKLALDCAGLEYEGLENNYISSITAPESLGGYALKEKANGANSGWMYTVNGFHPSYSLNDWDVTTGDEIIWHYVDDYTVEQSDRYEGSDGDETVWDTWLLAEDVNPAGIDPSAPEEPVVPDRPVEPDEPDEPDKPDEPDQPDVPDELVVPEEIREMYNKTAATLLDLTPSSAHKLSMRSEWMILGLVRSTKSIPASYENTYLTAVRKYLSTINSDGQLDVDTPTENMRVALALTALGYDPADFENYDLMEALEDVDWVAAQGNNSIAFALLAMDACDYGSTARADLIKELLDNQLDDGGWNITSGGSDQDTTMMVVQALAPYYETDHTVADAVDAALDYIKELQGDDGGFGTTAEGNAQVIVALTALGIDPASEEWCNSDGKSVIDALAGYFVGTGFRHDDAQNKYNQMASEQAFYALVAYIRYLNGQPGLYDMSARDSWPEEPDEPDQPDKPEEPEETYAIIAGESGFGSIRVPDSAAVGDLVEVTVKANYGYTLDTLYMDGDILEVDEAGRASFIMPGKSVILLAVFRPSESQITDLEATMNDLTVTGADEETYMLIQQILAAYDALTEEEQENLAEAYENFLQEARYFEELLQACIEDALDDLERYYDRLDRDDYSSENWKKLREIYTTAKSSLRKAAYEEQVEEILDRALDDMRDVEKGGEIEVTFRLIGDFPHEDGVNDHEEYVTWIETTEYELEPGSTVYDLFVMAIDDFDLNERGSNKNYVSTIQAPDILGGYWLGEFDNGPNSGWMYTVNGDHPSYGLQDWELEDGDEVIWHYVDDYMLEERRNSGRYYYRWLEADDISPEEYVRDKMDEILTVGRNGTVDPDKLSYRDLGRNVTFKFIPDKGYAVDEVIVDGKSMGSIETYTYKDLQIYSRIEVTFKSDIQARIDELPDAGEITRENYKLYVTLVEELRADYNALSAQEKRTIDAAKLIAAEERIQYFIMLDSIRLPFTDVAEGSWYYDAVVYAYANNLFNGTTATTFEPGTTMSRAMLVTVLWRMEGRPVAAAPVYFADVPAGTWYSDAVAWASGTGIVTGTDNGFDPDGAVTREQIATILYRYAKTKGWDIYASTPLTGFADGAETSSWATRAMEWACAEQLIVGADGRLNPCGQATRAEVATILMRLLEDRAG